MGSGREHDYVSSQNSMQNSFWTWDIIGKFWNRVYLNKNISSSYWERMKMKEPSPRFAHQVVYDYNERIHYLFGGNPGEPTNPYLRLGDFWKLELSKPEASCIKSTLVFLIRKQKFLELCVTDHMNALKYLQQDLASIVDHNNEESSLMFRKLSKYLCQPPTDDLVEQRTELFDKLLQFFPKHMKQPDSSLIEFIS